MSSPLFEPLCEKRASIDPSVGQTQEPTLIDARPALRLGPLEDEARDLEPAEADLGWGGESSSDRPGLMT
ncbi:MAG: hypothetical protein V3T85_07195 [Acidiferrobacterales bacterium]